MSGTHTTQPRLAAHTLSSLAQSRSLSTAPSTSQLRVIATSPTHQIDSLHKSGTAPSGSPAAAS